MSDNYEIDNDGIIHWKDRQERPETEQDKLMAEYIALEHEVVNSIAHHTDDPVKVARYHELKKILGIPDAADVFNQATEVLKKADAKDDDNSMLYDAIKKFKARK